MLDEQEINFARGGFSTVQSVLADYSARRIDGEFTCGWYGTVVNDERGSFCIVNTDSDLADQIGNYLRITHSYALLNKPTAVVGSTTGVNAPISSVDDKFVREISVYCLESHGIPYDLALSRRAYLALAPLWMPYLNVRVGEVLDGFDGTA